MTEAQKKIKNIEEELSLAFAERRHLIRGMLIALLAGEHILVLGPPGTAKSLLARIFADCTAGGSFFEILLTKFSTLEDVYGPISFKGLKEDRYERVLEGKAASRRVLFIDEIWKSSAAILNSLLTAMQERIFHNGTAPVNIPLETVVAASNEYPQDDTLNALYDRFLLRYWVDYISDEDSLSGLFERGGIISINADATLKETELAELREMVKTIPFGKDQVALMLEAKRAAEADGFFASDRTWIKATKLVKARAVLDGRGKVIPSDYLVLSDVIWKEHKDRDALNTTIGNAVDPYGSRAEAIIDGIRTAMKDLPDLNLLKTGQKSKIDMTKMISVVSGQLGACRDKILDVIEEGGETPKALEVKSLVEEALQKTDKLTRDVTFYREKK